MSQSTQASHQPRTKQVAGVVYAMVSLLNGAVYVGSTIDMQKRGRQHLAGIINGTHPHAGVAEHFYGHAAEDVEFRILDQAPVTLCESTKAGSVSESGEAWYVKDRNALEALELAWMDKFDSVINSPYALGRSKRSPQPLIVDHRQTSPSSAPNSDISTQ